MVLRKLYCKGRGARRSGSTKGIRGEKILISINGGKL